MDGQESADHHSTIGMTENRLTGQNQRGTRRLTVKTAVEVLSRPGPQKMQIQNGHLV
jgi:hypothetical protein